MLLVDASVWVAAVEADSRYHAEARSIVRDYGRSLAALDLTLYEIGNAVGVKQGRREQAGSLSRLLLTRCGDRFVRVDGELVATALELAAEHRLTAYDAAYVAAARSNGWQLVSTDVADLVSKGLAITPDAALYP